nr:hypothetical protein [uncultured Deefgea sp.]
MRDGQALRLAVEELVPGDVVHLAAGDKVPADLRLFHANELAAHEAMLTGESLPVDKHIDVLDPATQLAERGTMLLHGNAKGVVVATGLNTETGKIAASLLRTDAMITPLTRQIAQFANQLLWIIIALAVLTFAVQCRTKKYADPTSSGRSHDRAALHQRRAGSHFALVRFG